MTKPNRSIPQEPDFLTKTEPVSSPISELEKLMTMASAAEVLGLPYHTVQRAAARKLIPTYRLGDSKKYVRLKDILSRLESEAP